MKKAVVILSIFAVIACSSRQVMSQQTGTENNEPICRIESTEQSEESRQQGKLPPINERFLSYFPNMALGTHSEVRRLIPQKTVVEFLPDFVYPDYVSIRHYAIGKITNYRGLDLLVFGYEGERPYEGSYDNNTDSRRFLLLFKNGIPLTMKSDRGEEQRLSHLISYRYYGEGGKALTESYFDTDSTIITRSYRSESESATGYSVPIASAKEFRWKINSRGEREILEVRLMEFSSPFYDRNFMNEQNWTWFEENNIRAFPTKDEKWNININSLNCDYFTLICPQIDLYFYIEKIDGEYRTVFESYINEELIDRYIVGEPRNDIFLKKDYTNRSKVLKSPIIIKTSDGNLELLPNGKFLLHD